MSDFTVRAAVESDVPAMTDIYNHYVRETPITFDLEPWTVEKRLEWFQQFADTGRHRALVAEEASTILAYAYSGTFRAKAAYNTTVEVTVYARPDAKGRGIGRALYTELYAQLADTDIHRAVALITLPNDASIALHEKFGFVHKGTLDEIGRKFDRYWDVSWYEKAFD